ncbi:MAG TPA: hypothetical protein H9681_06465 [Firmicutes bacterium]|nr:hypothetical protein [Bacillota bacterium]
MKPLPNQRYELATWNPNLTVGSDYLISDGNNKYSVPFDLIGEKTAKVVSHFLTLGKEPEQGFKACASLTKLGEKYGVKKLESACDGVFSYTQAPSIRLISTILKSGTGASTQSGSGRSSGKGQFAKANDGTQTHDNNFLYSV